MKFHRGRDIVDLPPDTPIEGLEFSPKMRTVLFSSGAAIYASLIGFVMAAHVLHAKTHGDPRLKFVTNDVGHSIVTVEHVLEPIEGPHRLAQHGASSETSG